MWQFWFEQCPPRQNDDRVRVALRCEALEDRCTPATFTVNTELEDNNPNDAVVSLREAIVKANGTDFVPGGPVQHRIEFAAGVSGKIISLTAGQIEIQKSMYVAGPGAGQLTVQRGAGMPDNRLFYVRSNTVTSIVGLTLRDGRSPANPPNNGPIGGGAILSEGALTVTSCVISYNTSVQGMSGSRGGGIRATAGSLDINSSTISYNIAQYGGGIWANVPVRVTGGSIDNNTGGQSGGGLYQSGSTATFDGVGVSKNSALDGAGVWSDGAALKLTGGSKLFANQTAGKGGGVYVNGGSIEYAGVTIGDNTASVGDGVYLKGAKIGNNVVWNNDVEAS